MFQLESTFDLKRYLSSSERAGLAASLHLTETQVALVERQAAQATPYIQVVTLTETQVAEQHLSRDPGSSNHTLLTYIQVVTLTETQVALATPQ